MSHPQTPFLRDLADHLDANPTLRPVVVRESWRGDPELILKYGSDEKDVDAWASSTGADTIKVVAIGGGRQAHLRAVGRIGGHGVDVLAVVDNFRETVNDGDQLPVLGGVS